ncbi:MAG: hypothetical protein K0R41_2365, partial [Geminicoccaceae bacterium]|nr:hypothetical protein [Geminicoccaceae bacterium]
DERLGVEVVSLHESVDRRLQRHEVELTRFGGHLNA